MSDEQNKTKIYTRKTFYDLIWSKSLTKISAEFEVQLPVIKKICKIHNIPLPGKGYWTKLAFGKEVIQIPLPFTAEEESEINLGKITVEYKTTARYKHSVKVQEIKTQFPDLLVVPQKLTKPCPLVQAAKRDLKTAMRRAHRINSQIVLSDINSLNIEVTKEHANRMLRFVDSFIKLIRARGHRIEINNNSTRIIIYEEEFAIRFREKCNRKIVEDKYWSRNQLIPNGVLSIKLDKFYSDTEWKDGRLPIEDQLARIVADLEMMAEKEKVKRAERERSWAEQQRVQAIKDREKAIKKFELKRKEMLIADAGRWREAEELRGFIGRVEVLCKGRDVSVEMEDWLVWARRVLEDLDPFGDGVGGFVGRYRYSGEGRD